MVVVLYGVMTAEKTGKVELDEEDIIINDTVKQAEETTMKGYRNIALFGVDSTTGALTKNTRSDSIMIASINQDTGECKLVSVYRDTYLNKVMILITNVTLLMQGWSGNGNQYVKYESGYEYHRFRNSRFAV